MPSGIYERARGTISEAVAIDVYEHPGTTRGMIAVRTGLEPIQVTRAVDGLERDGQVERRPRRGCNVRVWPA